MESSFKRSFKEIVLSSIVDELSKGTEKSLQKFYERKSCLSLRQIRSLFKTYSKKKIVQKFLFRRRDIYMIFPKEIIGTFLESSIEDHRKITLGKVFFKKFTDIQMASMKWVILKRYFIKGEYSKRVIRKKKSSKVFQKVYERRYL